MRPSTFTMGLLAGLAMTAAATSPTTVTLSNAAPRVDDTGAIMDAHDGHVFFDTNLNLYVWAAASYGPCKEPTGATGCKGAAVGACGFQLNHNVSVWTSADLQNWKAHGVVFSAATSGQTAILFCPKMLYNPTTKLYVLWVNFVQGASFSVSYYSVATAPTPFGPFTVVTPQVTTLAYADTGDFSLFQDGADAYVIYTAHITAPGGDPTHQMSVEKLTPDYTASLGAAASSGFFGASFVEAPAMFKRNGKYYAVFGSCCCYCQSGSPPTVYVADSPLGPYATRNSLAPSGGNDASGTCPRAVGRQDALRIAADGDAAGQSADTFLPCSRRSRRLAQLRAAARGEEADLAGAWPPSAQQSDIFAYTSGSGETAFMWWGDRWQSAPDGLKAHDFTYWQPLNFTADGNVTSFGPTFLNNFTISVATPPAQ